ncbi:MAG TPA: peptide chain release factor 1 [Planctomycetota bacterium]|nr:peptide chain release factor 1 [Planctomycetota bacterium]
MDEKFLDKIGETEARARELEAQLSDPELSRDPGRFAKVGKQLAGMRKQLQVGDRYRSAVAALAGSRALLADPDPEVAELAREESRQLESEVGALERELADLFSPKDPRDEKNALLEIRAGAGGDEAALFAADLFRMYVRYAESLGWKVERLSSSETDGGGFREVIALVEGDNVFSRFKNERGVHRVQRVPATEAQGRIHTSTVTVAVMPEAEEVDIQIDPADLRIDVMRAGGPGGQSVNTTDSAVRVTHLPTGTVVQCQDEKSQHKNKAKALLVLRSRLLEHEQQKAEQERASERRAQVGSGDRSEKIRTYNFPQSRVTDHRAGVTLHRLDAIMQGDLDELLDAVRAQVVAGQESASEAS